MNKELEEELLENNIIRLLEIAGKKSDEIYEQGNIEISVDDVFAIQYVLNELERRQDHINTLKHKLKDKQETIEYYKERVKELKEEEEDLET